LTYNEDTFFDTDFLIFLVTYCVKFSVRNTGYFLFQSINQYLFPFKKLLAQDLISYMR